MHDFHASHIGVALNSQPQDSDGSLLGFVDICCSIILDEICSQDQAVKACPKHEGDDTQALHDLHIRTEHFGVVAEHYPSMAHLMRMVVQNP